MNETNHSGRPLVVALVIAAVKVSIVGAVFMELRGSTGALRVVICVSIGFVALLCLGVIGDIAMR
jgi:hypothetical protein